MSGRPAYHFRWSWTLPAPPEALWPLVADTNRFNRDTGLPTVTEAEGDDGLANARRRLGMVVKGLPLEWTESPFDWVRPHRFGVVRRYARGPLVEMRVLAELEPLEGDRTQLHYSVEAFPRGLLGRLAARIQIGILSRRSFGRIFMEYGEQVAARRREGSRDQLAQRSSARLSARLRDGARRLAERPVDPELAQRLVEHMASADDLTLARIRPYALADLWQVDRRAVLECCLEATRLGLLELRWDLLCPLCRGAKERLEGLDRLRSGAQVHCDTCRIEFGPDFDRSVELSFRPNPSVRDVGDVSFCVAGPRMTPHIEAQQLLADGESRLVNPLLDPGGYRVRTLDGSASWAFQVTKGARDDTVTLRLAPDGWHAEGQPASLSQEPRLAIENASGEERLIVVEHTAWSDQVVTGAQVTTLQRFRDLFSSEVLGAGEFLSVGTLALVFTDLRSSTAMYKRLGDPRAYGRVRDHFTIVRDAVEARGGTVVKTIGDAVMAAFTAPEDALDAMVAAQRSMTEHERCRDLVLKGGIHLGPCIAVNSNDRLDYFGTSVNIACRLGELSNGDDVVISEAMRVDPGVAQWLEEHGPEATDFEADIRGLDERIRAWRLRMPT